MNFLLPLVRQLPPETAHNVTINFLRSPLVPSVKIKKYSSLQQSLWGLSFSHPLGMAAGFDKNAQVYNALLKIGFSFTEIGTVTPFPQFGNPKPRLFRLSRDKAIINRMGFNNQGHRVIKQRLMTNPRQGIVGINIGKNKDCLDAISDYEKGLIELGPLADYLVINVSSPNTPGLRSLQSRENLTTLLDQIEEKKKRLTHKLPILLKIAPDLDPEELLDIAVVSLQKNLDGLIVSNTTITRSEDLDSQYCKDTGGLSGQPLFDLSTKILAKIFSLTQGKIPLIGVGGISSADQAYQKIKAGASLLQLYTALTYQGPDLIPEIVNGLANALEKDGFQHIKQAIGIEAESINSL